MEIKKIENKIALENQFDVEQQVQWCDCDCNVKHPKKNSSQVDFLYGLRFGKSLLANPTAAKQRTAMDLCDALFETYCYRTGTKKTTGWW